MNKKNILVVANPGKMNNDIFKWISNTDAFDLVFADNHERAIELSHQQLFDMALIDITDEEINDRKLKAVLPLLNTEILMVAYNGEAIEMLEAKVNYAFDMRKKRRMQRLLILDSSVNNGWKSLPPFSVN